MSKNVIDNKTVKPTNTESSNVKPKKIEQPKVKKLDKDGRMNTPKKKENGVELMPYDDETLKIFSLKKMNFKDMTGAQKNTLVALSIVVGLIVLSFLLPTIISLLGGTTIGNLRFFNRNDNNPNEKEEETSFALEGDYIILGKNTTITVEGIKFYNFTKGNNYQLVYNYSSKEDVEDLSAKKIYIEFYTGSKSLINRFAFKTDSNKLTANVVGLNQIIMSSNNFNKAYYVRVRVITDAVIDDLPDVGEIEDPNVDPNSGNQGDDPTQTPGGSTSNPSTPTVDKNKTMICNINEIDGSLKITRTFNVTLKDGIVSKYHVEYKISSLIEAYPTNYSKYYKKMMKQYTDLMKSIGTSANIREDVFAAVLEYDVDVNKYQNIEVDLEHPEKYDPDYLKEYLKQKLPYDLEIKKGSNREEAKQQLQAKDWICD